LHQCAHNQGLKRRSEVTDICPLSANRPPLIQTRSGVQHLLRLAACGSNGRDHPPRDRLDRRRNDLAYRWRADRRRVQCAAADRLHLAVYAPTDTGRTAAPGKRNNPIASAASPSPIWGSLDGLIISINRNRVAGFNGIASSGPTISGAPPSQCANHCNRAP